MASNNKPDNRKENVQKLLSDSDVIWREWTNSGLNVNQEFTIDFDFYSAAKTEVHNFKEFLNDLGYETSLKKVRMMIFFTGWQLQASLNRNWTNEILNENIIYLGETADKFETLIEGYGSHIKKLKSA